VLIARWPALSSTGTTPARSGHSSRLIALADRAPLSPGLRGRSTRATFYRSASSAASRCGNAGFELAPLPLLEDVAAPISFRDPEPSSGASRLRFRLETKAGFKLILSSRFAHQVVDFAEQVFRSIRLAHEAAIVGNFRLCGPP
jgi:hypothetical protein